MRIVVLKIRFDQNKSFQNMPSDTKAVAYAKQKHLNAYERIAAEHAQIAEERRIAEELKDLERVENEEH